MDTLMVVAAVAAALTVAVNAPVEGTNLILFDVALN